MDRFEAAGVALDEFLSLPEDQMCLRMWGTQNKTLYWFGKLLGNKLRVYRAGLKSLEEEPEMLCSGFGEDMHQKLKDLLDSATRALRAIKTILNSRRNK